jgi:endonuclease G, mitochondrial
MTYLTADDLRDVANAVSARVVYDPVTRLAVFAGIDRRVLALIPAGAAPNVQLALDLGELNGIERLVDGTVPLEVWLKNAGALLQSFPEAAVLQRALDKVLTRSGGTPAVADAAHNVPTVLQRIVERDDMVAVGFLEGGYHAGASVARVLVPRYENGNPRTLPGGAPLRYYGTSWLVTPDLLITNHHVVNARNEDEADASDPDLALQGAGSVAEFNYDADGMVPTEARVVKLEAWDKALDFALLRLQAATPLPPLRLRPERVNPPGADPVAVNIIQHPLGGAKRVALRNNHVYDCPYPKMRYFTDTQRGSSGSPVFDDGWKVIALHRATSFVQNVTFQGNSPGWVNEGVQVEAIYTHLAQRFPALHAEIAAAQA